MKANPAGSLVGTGLGSAVPSLTRGELPCHHSRPIPLLRFGVLTPALCSNLPPSADGTHPPTPRPQHPAWGRNALTVGDLHLVGRGSPLHPVAAVHGEGVRFSEKPAAEERRRCREQTPPARPPRRGSARGRREAEPLRDLGGSSRLTTPSPGSCGDTTRARPRTRTERRPPRAGHRGWRLPGTTAPSPRLSAPRPAGPPRTAASPGEGGGARGAPSRPGPCPAPPERSLSPRLSAEDRLDPGELPGSKPAPAKYRVCWRTPLLCPRRFYREFFFFLGTAVFRFGFFFFLSLSSFAKLHANPR